MLGVQHPTASVSPQKQRRSEAGSQPAPAAEPPWLAADIRVRIVDKALRGGALYLKKVFPNPWLCYYWCMLKTM